MTINQNQKNHIKRCLELARLGKGTTSPNPMVGAVVINTNGTMIGEGYHQFPGAAHAEINALEQAGQQAVGGELYINLEPCAHFGKTPPCVPAVINSGVKRVFIGMIDPNPLVAGQGIAALRQAGIEVVSGICEEECLWLNRGFIKRVTKGLPWLILKLATTLDGKIADRNGSSRWVSGGAARQYVHELRNIVDWIIIGANTAVTDNPQLDVRLSGADGQDGDDSKKIKNPGRAVITSRADFPSDLRIFDPAVSGAGLIFCPQNLSDTLKKNQNKNTEIVAVPASNEGIVDLKAALQSLAQRGANYVLCEGGAKLAAGLLENKLVDEIRWIVAPKILGDNNAISAIASANLTTLDQSISLSHVKHQILDNDIVIEGLPKYL